MLTRSQIIRQMEFNAQYGEPEATFSPRWHAENPGPGPDALPAINETERTVVVQLRRVLLASGDMTIADVAGGYELPEGATFID